MSDEMRPVGVSDRGDVVFLAADRKSEAELAAEFKARIAAAFVEVCSIMDEAASKGLLVRWDGVGPAAPLFKHQVVGLRIEKHY